jgi:hypothetical protein
MLPKTLCLDLVRLLDDQHVLPFDMWTVILDYWWNVPVLTRNYDCKVALQPIKGQSCETLLVADTSLTSIVLYHQSYTFRYRAHWYDVVAQWFMSENGSYVVAHKYAFGRVTVEKGLDFLSSVRQLQIMIAYSTWSPCIAQQDLIPTLESCITNL